MANYQHKRSAVAGKIPLASDLLDGEIAVNIKDRKLFAKDDQGVIFEFSGGNGGTVDTVNNIAPVNGNVTLNALNIPPTSDRLWLTQAERQLIASFDAYDKVESDDRYLLEANNLSDLTDASTARTNLGLGAAATRNVGESTGNVMEVGAFGLGVAKVFNTAQDLNTFTTSGEYAFTAVSNVNAPTINRFFLKTISYGSGQVTQTATSLIQTNLKEIYTRWYDGTSTWTPWVKHYHTGNILGTVSQSGGVPTGAIIESGSNVNGEYTKFADGTMICRAFVDYDFSTIGSTVYTFPASYVNEDVCASISYLNTALPARHGVYNSTSCMASSGWRVANTATTTETLTIFLTATGKWY